MDMDGNKKLQLTGYDYNAVAGLFWGIASYLYSNYHVDHLMLSE
jgi:hypothetical protein